MNDARNNDVTINDCVYFWGIGVVIDLQHLHRQTQGNRSLEREVLDLFLRQSELQIEHLKAEKNDKEKREVAHAIHGAALAVGAFDMARIAAAVESGEQRSDMEIAALAAAFDEARAFIVSYLAR